MRCWILTCLLLLAAGAWLRLDGIAYGLDFDDAEQAFFTNDTDAYGMTHDLRCRFLRGDFTPRTFLVRGPAGFYLLGTIDAAIAGAWALVHPGGWSSVVAQLDANPSLLFLVHRCASAVAGVLTIALVLRILRREFDATSALCGGAILGVAYLHVRDSHLATVDVLFALAVVAAVDQMLLAVRGPHPRRYVACGLLVGAATAVKYFGGLLGAPLVLAHFLARRAARDAGVAPPPHRRLAWALGACPLGFLLSAPGIVFALPELAAWVRHDTETLGPSLDGIAQWRNLVFHGRYTLLVGLGECASVLGLAGLFHVWRRGTGGRFLALATLSLVPAMFATWVLNVRYGMSFLVLCTLPAGVLMARILGRLPRAARPVLVCAVLAPSLARSLAFNRVLAHRDTRAEMVSVLRERRRPPQHVLGIGRKGSLPVFPYSGASLFVLKAHDGMDIAGRSIPDLVASPPPSILIGGELEHALTQRDAEQLRDLLDARYRVVVRLAPAEQPIDFESVGTPALKILYASPWRQDRPGAPLALFDRVDP